MKPIALILIRICYITWKRLTVWTQREQHFRRPLYPEVLKQAMETFHIESTKMIRYARQRCREDEMKKILEEIMNEMQGFKR